MALDAAVHRIALEIPGWSPPEQLLSLALMSAATAHMEGDIVEVGSWCGRSAVALALGLGSSRGRVHAIDPFPRRSEWRQAEDGTWSCLMERHGRQILACANPSVWDEPFQNDIAPLYTSAGEDGVRATFDRAVHAFDVADRVTAHVGDVTDFARSATPEFLCRLAFLDGSHGYADVCADLDVIEPYLQPGGWVCFDDAFTVYEGIDQAIRERVLDGPYENAIQVTRKMFMAQRRR